MSPGHHVRQIRVPGDIIIGGVFPVHTKSVAVDHPCGVIAETRGVHRVEAMLYALDIINNQRDFLRGFRLGALILDSCSNPAFALNQSLDFVRDLIGTNDASEFQCRDGSRPKSRRPLAKRKVAAVVGGSYSSVTVQIANLLRLFKIAQVSPASTNADLSDKNRFEYFARTVPSDNYQARAMIDIALHFNWTYLSLVFSADEYGELGADAFKKEARKVNICIAIEERISTKRAAMIESIDNLVKKLQPEKKEGARVVVLFVGTEYIPELLLQTAKRMNLIGKNRKKKKIIWLASEAWDRHNEAYTLGNRREAAEGAIVLMLESKRVPSFENYFLSLNPGKKEFERNAWLKELWRQKFDCEFGLPEESTGNKCENHKQTKDNFSPDDKVQFVIDAVFAIAYGLQALKKAECPNDTVETSWITRNAKKPHLCYAMDNIDGADFYQNYLLKVNFTSNDFLICCKILCSFSLKKIDKFLQGDGPAHYTILNYQPSRNQRRFVHSFKHNFSCLSTKDLDETCCWACSKCEDYEYLINETTCMDCGEGRLPTANRTSCYNIADVDLKHMRWTTWHSIVPAVIAGIGIFLTLGVVVIYIRYNETPVIKASGRELSYILLFSMIMCYSMTFVLVSKPTPLICAIKRTGIGFAFSCLYASLLVKTNRIARIFSQAKRTVQRPRCISPISQVLLTVLLAGVQLIGSLIWLSAVPPGTRPDYPTRYEVVLTCNVPEHHFLYSLAYDAALIVLCTIYAIKTRKVPENFNETKFIGFSMYTTCVIWFSWGFFFFGTGKSDFQIQTTTLCMSISMSANVALACIFSPKVWIILFEQHKNVRKQDGEYMLSRSKDSSFSQYSSLSPDHRRRNVKSNSTSDSPLEIITFSSQDTFL
ncbi:unnamed protein product [Enterobius vermicularis]|uniref:G_PROTEIN_RECEP_F3_4 domain-containing protein n=1 Tax=Enterobius vermicularis TaxID=51028 RepID=A0A158QB40_ENTVE|nr:unnamed protein product [Enterobius vermicularis]